MKRTDRIRRLIAGTISAVMLCGLWAAVVLSLGGQSAAITSALPNIERIVAEGGSFDVLELVPEAEDAAFGYLVSGYEPCADWSARTAQCVGKAARESCANDLLTQLSAKNLLSAGSASPLTLRDGSLYSELAPWEYQSLDDENKSAYGHTLTLAAPETARINASFALIDPESGDTGAYNIEGGAYRLAAAGETPTHVQTVQHFDYAPDGEAAEGAFYYQPEFKKLTVGDETPQELALYEKKEAAGGEPESYQYLGVLADIGILDAEMDYYIVAACGQPAAEPGEDHAMPYRAVGDSFALPAEGEAAYFIATGEGYEYVGAGGEYNITLSASAPPVDVTYSTVFYKGGYTSNNWFITQVFGLLAAPGGFTPTVTVRTPDALTAADVEAAELIVIPSGGFTNASDLSAEARDTLVAAAVSGTPVAVNRDAYTGAGMSLQSAVIGLRDASGVSEADAEALGYNFVGKNVYFFALPTEVSPGVSVSALVSDKLCAVMSGEYVASGFTQVLDTIAAENLYRRIANSSDGDTTNDVDPLSEDISVAAVLRHIINYRAETTAELKSQIRVLEIEPAKNTPQISKADVLSWYGAKNTTENQNRISITTMSTAEFIGKIEDLNETYDLIYIGDSTAGFAKTGMFDGYTGPDYNDNGMDGLLYTNIGDKYYSSKYLGGLLPGERSGGYVNGSLVNNAFRMSGNDLTESKAAALERFAAAGYPVVAADSLVMYATEERTVQLTSSLTAEENTETRWIPPWWEYNYVTTANSVTISMDMNVTPAVFSNGEAISGRWNLVLTDCDGNERAIKTNRPITDALSVTIPNRVFLFGSVGGGFWGGGFGDPWDSDGTFTVTWTTTYNVSGSVYTVSSSVDVDMTTETWHDPPVYRYEFSNYTSGSMDIKYNVLTGSSCIGIRTARVDVNSKLYDALEAIRQRENFFTVSGAVADTASLRAYLMLSKPQINLSSWPADYSIDGAGNMTSLARSADGYCYLSYAFSITDDTDPTPASTTYGCRLYVDQNADGLYTDDEELSDAALYRGGGYIGSSGSCGLKADVNYSLTRGLPESYAGIVPWKLVVYKNGSEDVVHDSATGYTRVAPKEGSVTQINILQIASKNSGSLVNLESQTAETSSWYGGSAMYSAVTGKMYGGIYGKLLADVVDFNVRALTIEADDLSSMNLTESLKAFLKEKGYTDESLSALDADEAGVSAVLGQFDMIIIGFADEYDGLSQAAAGAVVDFIETGKSVLFTHDTTSLTNFTSSGGMSGSKPDSWGYYFNTILREPVGLDRYGVTGQRSGFGYDDALDPGGAAGAQTSEIQGYTNYSLFRWKTGASQTYTYSSIGSANETSSVSQVNTGQITTYPYNINTALMRTGTGGNTMSVGGTHEQYYQINMSDDDIVVWYCLSGGSGTYYPSQYNDVRNAYYLYSRGNVLYSGVGHSSASGNYTGTVSESFKNEAKLFVNTMIAAYYAGNHAPEIRVLDADGKDMQYLYYSADLGAVTGTVEDDQVLEGSLAANNSFCFTINDTNMSGSKSIAVSFFYTLPGGEKTEIDNVSVTYEGLPVTSYANGVVYKAELPMEVLGRLHDNESISVSVSAATTIDGAVYTGTDSLELRRLGLFELG